MKQSTEHSKHTAKSKQTELGRRLRERRDELGLSAVQLGSQTDMADSTIIRIENGDIATPAPDKLAALAEALGLATAELFTLANYTNATDLPSFRPYLRRKYQGLPPEAVNDLEATFQRLAQDYGIDPNGPSRGEDEAA